MRAIPSSLERRLSRHPTKDQSAPTLNPEQNTEGGLGARSPLGTDACGRSNAGFNDDEDSTLDRPHGGLLQHAI